MHLKSEYHPKAFGSAQLAGRDDRKGWERRKGRALLPTPTPLQSLGPLLGACFMSFSPLPVSSLSLCCFPSHQPSLFLPHPSPSCLSPSPRGLIYGCGAPETGMTTHTFLCFVSSLACWLDLWLTACTWCVFAQYSCQAVSVLPQSKNVSVYLLVLFVVVKQRVSPAKALNTQSTFLKSKSFILVPTYRCV